MIPVHIEDPKSCSPKYLTIIDFYTIFRTLIKDPHPLLDIFNHSSESQIVCSTLTSIHATSPDIVDLSVLGKAACRQRACQNVARI